MVRASAKNHANVAIVVSPDRYDEIIAAIAAGGTTLAQRKELAREAFRAHGVVRRRGRLVARQRRRARPARRGVAVPGVGRRHLDEGRRPALRRELAPARGASTRRRRAARHRAGDAAARQGDVVQQLRRRGCRGAGRVRLRRAGRRDHQARQPVRHRGRVARGIRPDRRRPPARARVRPGVGVRRRDRGEPHGHARDGRDRLRHLHRGARRARRSRARRSRCSRRRRTCACSRCPRASRPPRSSCARSRAGCCCSRPTGTSPPASEWTLAAGEPADEATLADLEFAWKACRAVKSNAILLAAAARRSASAWARSTASTRAGSPSSARGSAPPGRSRHPTPSSRSPTACRSCIDGGRARGRAAGRLRARRGGRRGGPRGGRHDVLHGRAALLPLSRPSGTRHVRSRRYP